MYALVALLYDNNHVGSRAPLRRGAQCIHLPVAPFIYRPHCPAARVDVALVAASEANMRESIAESTEIVSYEKWIQQLASRERAYLLEKDVTANGCCLLDSWIAVLAGGCHT